jgi:creatinine amidohydrolase
VILEQITMADFVEGLKKTRTVAIPCGALEEHGPHLPLGTDTIHAHEVCCEAASRRPMFVAPHLSYGVVRSTRHHPGTVGIRPATFRALVADLVFDLHRQGLRHFLIVSGHASGLQIASLTEAGEELLNTFPDIRMAVVSVLDLAPEAWGQVTECEDDSHAGEVETSVMLHLRPEWVGKDRPREWPRFPKHLLVRDKLRHWPGGVWGDASLASSDKGRRLFELSVAALVSLVEELESGKWG